MDEIFDEDLMNVMGDRYVPEEAPKTKSEPAAQNYAAGADDLATFWKAVKFPLLFLSLILFAGWAANAGLMDTIVAVPGMCVCSACFGWSIKK